MCSERIWNLYILWGNCTNCTNVHGVFFHTHLVGHVLRGDGAGAYCVDCYVVMGGDIISNDVTRGGCRRFTVLRFK